MRTTRADTPSPQTDPQLERARGRLVWTFFIAVAVAQTGYILAATVSSLAGGELASTSLSGLPSAFGTIGTASGALAFTWAAKRFGRTISFTVGFTTGAIGAAIGALAVFTRSFPLLLLGMVVLGLGYSNVNLSRYAAADLRPGARRATTIGLIVWAGTIGAVLGPRALKPAGDAAIALGFEDLVGPYLGGALLFLVGATIFALLLRPDPSKLAVADEVSEIDAPKESRSRSELLAEGQTRLALVSMAFGQGVMSLVMVQTPLHLRRIGEGLDTIGNVMTAHTLGMFAIAPLTGFLVARLGTKRMIGVGSGVLITSCAMAYIGADPSRTSLLLPALLLLGVGWNFCFVAGSTLLMEGLNFGERLHLQGVGDTLVWVASGTAGIISGLIVATTSYSSLSLLGGIGALLPLVALAVWRSRTPAEIAA